MTQSSSRAKPLHDYPQLVPGGTVLSHYGVDSSQYNALSWISDDTVLIPAGKFLLFVNIKTGQVESQEGPFAGGVGTVAVHPSRNFFLVGERSPKTPRLLVHEWPSRMQVGEFGGSGCSVGYAACCFDRDGTRVATVGAAPDYTLAVWDWESRTMALRSKCFSSDVYTVCFSTFDNSLLVTGGSGHIKFWSMAETFTGLKLQGTLGKFGRLEISNVSGFVVLPDGKVLSGSESGSLLLWEGDLVKCSFVSSVRSYNGGGDGAEGVVPCHKGAINAVALVHDARIVVTFGDDGWIRYWSREELELAEGDGVPALYAPRCLMEQCVNPNSQLRSATLSCPASLSSSSPSSSSSSARPEWVVLDSRGTITTAPLPSLEECLSGSLSAAADELHRPAVVRFNGGGITCCATSPVAHVAVTGGEDGVVRLLDYLTGAELTHISWPRIVGAAEGRDHGHGEAPDTDADAGAHAALSPCAPVATVAFFANDPSHCHVVSGFGDGTVRLLMVEQTPSPHFTLLGQWKPHTSDLFATVLSVDERSLCSVARDGTAFFFVVSPSYDTLEPVGFCKLPLPDPTCADWDERGGGCFVGFAGGQVLSIRAPRRDEVNQEESFEFLCEHALLGLRQRRVPPPVPENEKKPDEEDDDILEEKDNGPWAISLIRRLPGNSGRIVVGMQKEELLYTYEGTVRYPDALCLPALPPTGVEPPNYVEDPEENLCYRDFVPQHAFLGPSGKQLLVVCNNAGVIVREASDPTELAFSSAAVAVSIMNPAHDSTRGCITSAQTSFDGSLVITAGTDGLIVTQVRAGHAAPERATPAPTSCLGVEEEDTTAEDLTAESPVVLSIQAQKEADDDARARAEAERRRKEFLEKVFALQERHGALLQTNNAMPAEARLPTEEMRLDDTLQAKLAEERNKRVEAARKEYAVESARESLRTKKLRNRFVDNLLYDRFLVHSFHGGFSVASFRTADPSAAISRLQAEIVALEASDGSDNDEFDEQTGGGSGEVNSDGAKAVGAAANTLARGAGGRQPPGGAEDALETDDNGVATSNASGGGGDGGGGDGGGTAAAAAAAAALQETPPRAAERDSSATTSKAGEQHGRSTMSATVRQQLQKADERREERQTRRDGYAALLATAPSTAEDEALLAEMERRDLAERGECVLRTDPHYKSRSDFRPAASAKLSRMIALEHTLVGKRSEFNERLLCARERKRGVLEALNRVRAKIRQMNEELGDYTVDAEPLTMQSDEEPEKVFEVDRAGLDAFAKNKALEKMKEEEAKKAQRGFGADLAEAPQQQRQSIGSKPRLDSAAASSPRRGTLGTRGDSRVRGSRKASRATGSSRQSALFVSAANRDRMEAEVKAKLESMKLSEMEEEERAMHREKLSCERQRLADEAEEIMRSFDDDMYSLFRQHADVEADLCLGHVHLLLLFREYQMLLVFRNQDRELRRELREAKTNREATRKGLLILQKNLKDYDAALSVLQEKLRLQKRDAEAYIQDASPADRVTYLLKVFNRHIKRRKNVDDEEDNDDITSDDEDDDVDDGDSDIEEELCPPNCDFEVWTHILTLREARLDITDEINERRKKRDDTSKQLEQSNSTMEGIVSSVKACLTRIEELNNEKRRQLNLLNVVVPLRCSQVKCLDGSGGGVPDSLWDQEVVVLPEEELDRLSARVVELAHQKEHRREEIASMTAELQRLQAEKVDVQKVHAHWEAQVHEVMMLKFGRHVDLEMLESCGTSRRIESKKEELRRVELHWDREVRKHENRIAALRDELQQSLLHNTHLLQDMGDYEGERQLAERALAKASTCAMRRFHGSRVATKADRANLRELIAAQQEEMDALNAEIFMLRRKGGHAYSPAAATR